MSSGIPYDESGMFVWSLIGMFVHTSRPDDGGRNDTVYYNECIV
jgi:hypothetical protein